MTDAASEMVWIHIDRVDFAVIADRPIACGSEAGEPKDAKIVVFGNKNAVMGTAARYFPCPQ